MDESEQEKMLDAVTSRTERIEGILNTLILELRTAAVFLVVLTMALKTWSTGVSFLATVVITSIFRLLTVEKIRKCLTNRSEQLPAPLSETKNARSRKTSKNNK